MAVDCMTIIRFIIREIKIILKLLVGTEVVRLSVGNMVRIRSCPATVWEVVIL